MLIYMPVVEHALIPNPRMIMIMICKILQDMDEEDLKEYHSLNTMLFNYRSVMVYSLLFSTQVDYVKYTVLMLGFVLNPIVFNGYEQINQCWGLNAIMDFEMQLEQGLRKMYKDWDVKSSSLHPCPVLLDI